MTRRQKPKEEQGPPEVRPIQGIELLKQVIGKGESLLAERPLTSEKHGTWELLTKNYLEKAFGRNSPNVGSVTEAGAMFIVPVNAPESWWESRRAETLTSQLSKLRGLVELLETEVQLQGGHAIRPERAASGHRIFVVHGHDEAALQAVSRFLEKLGHEIIILREQPNKGRTIIEKFEEYGDVGFAVVLLTPDDRGGTAAATHDQQQPRARQNVIFELGYFIGRLTRQRVCTLYRKGVELPSDYSGVLYHELDDKGAWKVELAKELRAAKFDIDMNTVF